MSVRPMAAVPPVDSSPKLLTDRKSETPRSVPERVKFFEKVAEESSCGSPPLTNKRLSNITLEGCTEVENDEENKLPKQKPSGEKAESKGERSLRFQLDLNPVLYQRKKKKQVVVEKGIKRPSSMSYLLSLEKGKETTSNENEKPSFVKSVYSPRIVRSYVPEDIDQIKEVNISYIPDVDEEVKDFEKKIRDSIKADWNNSEKKKVNAEVIEENIHRLCRKEVDSFFNRVKNLPLPSYHDSLESPRLRRWTKLVQKSGVILFPVVYRLKIFRDAAIKYVETEKQVSTSGRSLINSLNNLILPESYSKDSSNEGLVKGKDISIFMDSWDEFCKQENMSKYVRIIEKAFGDSKKEREKVMAILRKWATLSEETLTIERERIRQMDGDNILAKNISLCEYEWREDLLTEKPISKILPFEIVRCLHTGVGIPFKRLVINGVVVYDEERDRDKPLPKREDYIFDVIKQIYLGGFGPEVEDNVLKEYVDHLIKFSELPKKEQEDLFLDDTIPCINVLRLITNSAWGHGDLYIRELFPGLFKLPYWTKAVQSLVYTVKIVDKNDFAVRVDRDYASYRRLNEKDEKSYAVDLNRPLVPAEYSWTLSDSDGWVGVLGLEDYEVSPNTDDDDKWNILYSMIHFANPKTPEGKEEAPETPRKKSGSEQEVDGKKREAGFKSYMSSSKGSSKGKERDDLKLPLSKSGLLSSSPRGSVSGIKKVFSSPRSLQSSSSSSGSTPILGKVSCSPRSGLSSSSPRTPNPLNRKGSSLFSKSQSASSSSGSSNSAIKQKISLHLKEQ